VGTLFQAALLPGIFLAGLYAAYAFGFALVNPSKAPAVELDGTSSSEPVTRNEALTWFLGVPAALILGISLAASGGLVGNQSIFLTDPTQQAEGASLRTNVSEQCQAAMIELHGQEAWDTAVAERAASQEAAAAAAVGEGEADAAVSLADMTEEQIAELRATVVAAAAPIGSGVAAIFILLALILAIARGVSPTSNPLPLILGGAGVALAFVFDMLFIDPLTGPGATFLILAVPTILAIYGCREAFIRLARNDLLRVVFPPLILIVAVLGSILGGITNPTPAAALGAAGAIMLAAYRKLKEENGKSKIVIWASFAIIIMILLGVNFDLRITREVVPFEDWVAYVLAQIAYHFAFFGLLFSCWVLFRSNILSPVVRETAKVTSMVFTILIGSQLLNLVLISFGGEHHIQQFLRSFDNEMVVFFVVMAILFVLGFVLDFLEIIYIVIPIVGPGDLWRHAGPEMGDDHDRGEPADVVPDTALRLRAVLSARGGATAGDHGSYLSRGATLRGDPGVGACFCGCSPGSSRSCRTCSADAPEIENSRKGPARPLFHGTDQVRAIRSQRLPHGSAHCATRP
jgi:TRAP-type mannitol/chloroaromatic compound transport system permease large subunit